MLPLRGQYAGPAILSRGEAPAAMAGPTIEFRPFVSVTGTYSAGLSGVSVVNSQGDLPNDADYGVTVSGGISGSHKWRHTLLGIDYRISFTHYARSSFYDAVDQGMSLGLTHQITRHVTFTLRETPGMFSRQSVNVGLSQAVPFDPSQSNIPRTDFYDNRTIYNSTQADLQIQKTARLSFDMGGGLFVVVRRSSALYGTVGALARGDIQYRVSRRSTVGVTYNYSLYHYLGILSNTTVHGLAGTYAVRLSRLLEFSGYAGAARVESKFIQSVAVDPAVAALLGITSTQILNHQMHYYPNFSARLSRTFSRGVAYVAGGESVTPGNGLFLASRTASVVGGYGYTGLRHWSIGLSASYIKSFSFINNVGNYGGVAGSFSISRQLMHNVNFVAAFTANQYQSSSFQKYNRLIYSASVGLGWTPGDVPLRIW